MRRYSIDICRVLACMAVVMIHTVMLFWDFDPSSPTWVVYNLLAVLVRCGVPLFFMISGALLLGREELDIKKHLKRMGHFLLLFCLWSVFCAVFDNSFLQVWFSNAEPVELIFGSYYHLWYLPAMLLCYAFIPVLHSAVHKKPFDSRYALAIFGGLILIYNLRLIPGAPRWLSLLLGHFGLSNLRYLCYVFLGWYLLEHMPKGKKLALLGLAAMAAVLLYSWLNLRHAISVSKAVTTWYSYTSIAMVLLSSFVFSLCGLVSDLPRAAAAAITELSDCTLGIYLLHPLFISGLKCLHLDFTRFNTFIFFPLCYLGFLLLPLVVSLILRRIPGIKKLVT